jgi:hypothetical protein
MNQKYIIVAIGGIVILGVGVFVYAPSGEVMETQEQEGREAAQDIDLLPPRSQERIVEAADKDTAFKEAEEIEPVTCSDSQCFERYYEDIVTDETIAKAFVDLKVRYDESAVVRSLCHPLTHVIGRAAAKKYPDVGDAYRQGDHFCWSGYYHGVMEGILRDTKPTDLPDTIDAICNSIPGKETFSFDYYNCVHGLGHGVMYITDNELFDALILCDNLSGGWEKESCYGGVFMENVITDFENHFTKYLKPDELMYPCSVVPEKNKHACYLMQTSYVLKENGYDFKEAFELCSQIGESHINTCYQSIGRDASGSTVSHIERTKNYCLIGLDFRQQSNCAIGAVKDFISYFHSDTQAKQFCAALGRGLQDICLNTATQYYRSFEQAN